MVQRSDPIFSPGHRHGSAIVLSPSPPVVWWGCGAIPLPRCGVVGVWCYPPPPLWCGVCVCVCGAGGCGVCMTIYIYTYVYIYIYIWHGGYGEYGMQLFHVRYV